MKNLTHYIDNRNSWNSFFPGNTTITFPLSQKTVDDLARSLDGDLSPENVMERLAKHKHRTSTTTMVE